MLDWSEDCAKDAWVSKMPSSGIHRYQMAKQIYGLLEPSALAWARAYGQKGIGSGRGDGQDSDEDSL